MSKFEYHDALSKLGLEMGNERESRGITVLRAILNTSDTLGEPHTFGEIYDQILSMDDKFEPSKAWVHRLLKSLLEDGLIRLESPEAPRNRYIADVNSIANGLEKIKEAQEEKLEEELKKLKKDLSSFSELDVGVIAEHLIEDLTGKKQTLSSRFIKGIEELHRVLKNNIHAQAEEGDIIRSNMTWLGSLAKDSHHRIRKDIEAASRGVEVRWMISSRIFQMEQKIKSGLPSEELAHLFQDFFKLRRNKMSFDLRIHRGAEAYNHVSLNRDALAMIITDEPLTATYVTRDFNAELIDNTVDNFDALWNNSISLFELKGEDLEKLRIDPNGVIGKILAGLETEG
ncbi:hypothetical protein EU537_09990 [Candidatus Thorarchaeota archaeon]|nr:MAG: hypothetical protein EU537_09990 [Candidatus Thorarchaeota archaeon]